MTARGSAIIQHPYLSYGELNVASEIDALVETTVYLYSEGRRVTKAVARAHGLTGPQVTAVKLLEQVGELSLSDLSTRMSAKNSTITGLVDRMVRDGLIERRRSEADRCVILISLTKHGSTLAAQIPVSSIEIFAGALRSLSVKDRRTLLELLTKLSEHVRNEVGRPDD